MNANKKRVIYLGIFLLLFIVEFLIARYVRDSFIRPYVGDMLVVVLLYFLVRIFIPEGILRLPLWIFLFAVMVELSQYFHLADVLGLSNGVARIILGATFDLKDIACYGVGCLLLALLEKANKG